MQFFFTPASKPSTSSCTSFISSSTVVVFVVNILCAQGMNNYALARWKRKPVDLLGQVSILFYLFLFVWYGFQLFVKLMGKVGLSSVIFAFLVVGMCFCLSFRCSEILIHVVRCVFYSHSKCFNQKLCVFGPFTIIVWYWKCPIFLK